MKYNLDHSSVCVCVCVLELYQIPGYYDAAYRISVLKTLCLYFVHIGKMRLLKMFIVQRVNNFKYFISKFLK
jgi:hypothetical protein